MQTATTTTYNSRLYVKQYVQSTKTWCVAVSDRAFGIAAARVCSSLPPDVATVNVKWPLKTSITARLLYFDVSLFFSAWHCYPFVLTRTSTCILWLGTNEIIDGLLDTETAHVLTVADNSKTRGHSMKLTITVLLMQPNAIFLIVLLINGTLTELFT